MRSKMIFLWLSAIFTSNLVFAAENPVLAEKHVAKGVTCQQCHQTQPPKADVATDQCLACHGKTYEVLAKTTDKGDINFHDTHLGEANCQECHKGHNKSSLVCDQCHEFQVAVP